MSDNLEPTARDSATRDDTTAASTALTVVENESLLPAIISMAKDPTLDVDKLRALLEFQVQLETRQAEITYTQAVARVSARLPQVPKNGRVSLGDGKGSYPFAKWEDMDKIIRPLLADEGLFFQFTSEESGGRYLIKGKLRHRDGHFESATVSLPPNVGPGRNDLQAMGGTLSYGKRYCAEMLLNIVREGQDTDGNSDKPFGGFAGAKVPKKD